MHTTTASLIHATQFSTLRFSPIWGKGVQTTLLAGLMSLAFLSSATAADFSGKLKGVTITDAQAVNKAPIASFTFTNDGTTFTFDASGSADPDGSITDYQWDFGNGTKGTGATINTVYTPGTYPVTLTIIDNAKGVALAQQSVTYTEGFVLEDAEDGTITGWKVYDNDPTGATITNATDTTRQSKVIVFSGSGLNNSYLLATTDGTPLYSKTGFNTKFSLKYSESFKIYFYLTTSAGTRYMIYQDGTLNSLGATSTYLYIGLGNTAANGQWNTFSRDIQADVNIDQPGVAILSIDKILVKGSGSVDDIIVSNTK